MRSIMAVFNQGRYDDAERLLRQFTVRYPLHGFGWKLLAHDLGLLGRHSEALSTARKAVELIPNDPELHVNLGKALQDQRRLPEAEASYRRALELEPGSAFAHNNLGSVFVDQGKADEAEACFRRALDLKPDFETAHTNLGNALRNQGRFAEAEASFREAVALDPHGPEAHNNLGDALHDLGRFVESEACYRKALAIKPDWPRAHNNLGIVLRDQARFVEAEASFRAALLLEPDYAKAHNNLGIVLRDQGRLDEAGSCYRSAVELAPTWADAHINLSMVLDQLVPPWHVPMMNDARRNAAYLEALRTAVKPDSSVLEIGAGSGLLAMIAARFGARQVVTCEAVPLIAGTARAIVAANGLESSVSVISKKSTDVRVGVDLPQRANLMVSEIFSSELLGERVLSSIEDAKRRLLKPDAKIIPARASIVFALFGGEAIRNHVRVDDVLGFDLGVFNEIASPKRLVYRDDLDIELLTDTAEAFAFDFAEHDYFPAARKKLRLPIKVGGRCYGVAQWLRLKMDDTIEYENHPSTKTPAATWQTCLYRFPIPVDVRPGQTALVEAEHNRRSIWFFFEGLKEQGIS
jgi:tetratricopeptide (TPR) repeat protein